MSNTLRLYRELCRIDPSRKVHDITFERERKDIMKDLGYDIGEISKPVSPLKYHGKMARRRHVTVKSLTTESKKKKKLYDALVAAEKSNQIMKEVAKLVNDNKTISHKICNEFEDHIIKTNKFHKSKENLTKLINKTNLPIQLNLSNKKDLNESGNFKKVPCAVIIKPKTIVDEIKPIKSLGPSHNRWSTDELLLLNNIFNDIPLPKYIDIEHENLYFNSFTQRYRVHYPNREKSEIIKKIKGLIRRKQLKLPGEIEYWENFKR